MGETPINYKKRIRLILEYLKVNEKIKGDNDVAKAIGKSPSYISQAKGDSYNVPHTKTVYESLLKLYNLEIKGDTENDIYELETPIGIIVETKIVFTQEQVDTFYDIIPEVLKEVSSTMRSKGMPNESIKDCIEKINISLAKTIFGMAKLPTVQEYKKHTFAGKKENCEFCRIPFIVNNQHQCDDCGMDFMFCTAEGEET